MPFPWDPGSEFLVNTSVIVSVPGYICFSLKGGNFLFYFLLSDMLTALQENVHTPRSGVGKDEITLGEVEQEATCCLIK